MTPMEELNSLLQNLPNYSLISESMKQKALDGAQVPDSLLRWPGEEDYEPTYDVYFAALSLLGFLQAQPIVTGASSEGTSVQVEKPEWGALIAYYRGMSPIIQATSGQVLQEVPIPGGPHVYKTDMSGRYDHYGDVDTDLG